MKRLGTAIAGLALVLFTATAGDAEPGKFVIEQAERPAFSGEIVLGTPVARDLPPESWGLMNGTLDVRNVSQASIIPFLPEQGRGNGAAVIVAPGGAFLGLAMEAEGFRTARWLARHGIAAFVLKYRLMPTPPDFAQYRREMIAIRTGDRSVQPSFAPPPSTPDRALEDGLAAMRLVRDRAAGWGVDPARVGMMGYSAGAMTTLSVALADGPQPRPAFIAPIYGPLQAVNVPADAPPMYNVIASDDGLFWRGDTGLISSWWKAGRPVEFHLHQSGGHGFGPGAEGTTTAGWLDGFRRWLELNGFLAPLRNKHP